MKWLKRLGLFIVVIVLINASIMAINILQNGAGGWDGRSLEQIFQKSPASVKVEDLLRLSKSELMQAFYAAPAPDFDSMRGEYQSGLFSVGVLSPIAGYFTNHLFGPGLWKGKAFYPFEADKGWGYNIFESRDEANQAKLVRTRKMDTWIGKSEIDDRESFHLLYKAYNGGLVESMHDEIRRINNTLCLGMGYMTVGGGSINPIPFYLQGSPTEWVGIDKE